jgi:hypothetical protein
MGIRLQCVCIDSADPPALAGFWQRALGWRRTHEEPDKVRLEPPIGGPEDGVAPELLFLRVPEAKAGKDRLHLATYRRAGAQHEDPVVVFAWDFPPAERRSDQRLGRRHA